MLNNSNNTATHPAILPEEYDFHSVPKNELKDCVYYEYARESKAIISEVRQLRRQFLEEVKRRKVRVGERVKMTVTSKAFKSDLEGGLLDATIFSLLALSGGFPNKPWQRLSVSEKQHLTGFIEKGIGMKDRHMFKEFPPVRFDTYGAEPALGEMTLNDWRKRSTPERFRQASAAAVEKTIVSGFFRVNSGYTRELLIEQFGEWLSANQLGREHKVARGRHSERDALNRLGALRLRYFCPWPEAQRLIAPLKPVNKDDTGMQYGDHKAWNRACDGAVSYFRGLFMLPVSALPKHNTDGWRK